MPSYEYLCEQCGGVFEVAASIKEKTAGLDPECPNCHLRKARQLIGIGLAIRASGGGSGTPPPCCDPGGGAGCCG